MEPPAQPAHLGDRLRAAEGGPCPMLTWRDVWLLENGRVQPRICDDVFLIRIARDQVGPSLVWKNVAFWQGIDTVAVGLFQWKAGNKREAGSSPTTSPTDGGYVTYQMRLRDANAAQACSFLREITIATPQLRPGEEATVPAVVVQRSTRNYSSANRTSKRERSPEAQEGPQLVSRTLAAVHTWTFDVAPPEGADAQWIAMYSPKDEVNLWKFPPPVRKLLVKRLYEGLIIPAAMLTDEQFGVAAQGALSGYKLVAPRKGFKYPLEARTLDLIAAGEILDLWNRPAVRLVVPRILVTMLSSTYTGRIPHWTGGSFDGTIVCGAYQGHCTVWLKSCGMLWVGNCKDSLPHGHGCMSSFSPTGELLWRYTGEWAAGAQHGEGVEESFEGGMKTVQQGVWREGKYKESADTP